LRSERESGVSFSLYSFLFQSLWIFGGILFIWGEGQVIFLESDEFNGDLINTPVNNNVTFLTLEALNPLLLS